MPKRVEALAYPRIVSLEDCRTHADDEVERRQPSQVRAKTLADQPTDPVAGDRGFQIARRDRHAEARGSESVRNGIDREHLVAEPTALCVGSLEFRRAAQAALRRETQPRRSVGADTRRWHRARRPLGRQAFAALGAAPGQDFAAVLGGHPGPESVCACAAHLARLVCTFHDFKALKTDRKMARQGTQRARACQYECFRALVV